MRIGSLSRLFHVGRETIRYYRENAILQPHQDANGYFEYTLDDIAILFELIQMRQMHAGFSSAFSGYLSAIPNSEEEVVHQDMQMLSAIDETIQRLSQQKHYLRMRCQYRKSLLERGSPIQDIPTSTGLHFLRLRDFSHHPELVHTLLDGLPTYQSLVIDKNAFDSGSSLLFPAYALGFTQENYEKTRYYQGCDLSAMEQVPDRYRALRYIIHLQTLSSLFRSLFAPVDDYMHTHSLSLCAPVTSIILSAACGHTAGFDVLFRFLCK